ncbi:hypothetical protein ACT80S_18925 [Ramlibacter sp. MAHUQ-53]|uniref:hypothetical protein n=1 Tax=unclassified Ramlibacter TaxID=2617605 RepID=UPI00362BCB77
MFPTTAAPVPPQQALYLAPDGLLVARPLRPVGGFLGCFLWVGWVRRWAERSGELAITDPQRVIALLRRELGTDTVEPGTFRRLVERRIEACAAADLTSRTERARTAYRQALAARHDIDFRVEETFEQWMTQARRDTLNPSARDCTRIRTEAARLLREAPGQGTRRADRIPAGEVQAAIDQAIVHRCRHVNERRMAQAIERLYPQPERRHAAGAMLDEIRVSMRDSGVFSSCILSQASIDKLVIEHLVQRRAPALARLIACDLAFARLLVREACITVGGPVRFGDAPQDRKHAPPPPAFADAFEPGEFEGWRAKLKSGPGCAYFDSVCEAAVEALGRGRGAQGREEIAAAASTLRRLRGTSEYDTLAPALDSADPSACLQPLEAMVERRRFHPPPAGHETDRDRADRGRADSENIVTHLASLMASVGLARSHPALNLDQQRELHEIQLARGLARPALEDFVASAAAFTSALNAIAAPAISDDERSTRLFQQLAVLAGTVGPLVDLLGGTDRARRLEVLYDLAAVGGLGAGVPAPTQPTAASIEARERALASDPDLAAREQAQAFALRPIRLQDTLNRILLGAAATPVRAALGLDKVRAAEPKRLVADLLGALAYGAARGAGLGRAAAIEQAQRAAPKATPTGPSHDEPPGRTAPGGTVTRLSQLEPPNLQAAVRQHFNLKKSARSKASSFLKSTVSVTLPPPPPANAPPRIVIAPRSQPRR